MSKHGLCFVTTVSPHSFQWKGITGVLNPNFDTFGSFYCIAFHFQYINTSTYPKPTHPSQPNSILHSFQSSIPNTFIDFWQQTTVLYPSHDQSLFSKYLLKWIFQYPWWKGHDCIENKECQWKEVFLHMKG